MCSTCIFRPGNLMDLHPGRVRQLIDEACDDDGAIVCHQTLEEPLGAVCRGFFDRFADRSWPLRYAKHKDAVIYV